MTDERPRPGPGTRAIRAASRAPEDGADPVADFGQALEAAREA